MDLYKDILIGALSQQNIKVTFENIENPNEAVEQICCKAIQRIRDILNNESLDDFACIEEIVTTLESIGSNGGSRHDYG